MEVVCYGYDKYLFHTSFCFRKKNKNEKVHTIIRFVIELMYYLTIR